MVTVKEAVASETTEVFEAEHVPKGARDATIDQSFGSRIGRVGRVSLTAAMAILAILAMPTEAHAGIFGVFDAIFGLIAGQIGTALQEITTVTRETQQLYESTMWPLALINQARGFVSNSITGYRSGMSSIFYMPVHSATLQGPEQMEQILHSRDITQLAGFETTFHANYGTVPVANTASNQDRLMMDMDDALGQENLKATIASDQGADTILAVANTLENQAATATPGSAPFITAQAQVADLRCQAFMQKMLAAQLRQEAGRIAHDSALMKRRSQSVGSIGNTISTALSR